MRKEHKETVTIERVARTDVFCDICGNECERGGSFDVNEVEIRVKTGQSYPGHGWGEEYRPDICMACAKDKVIPALEALGCKAEWKDWDW